MFADFKLPIIPWIDFTLIAVVLCIVITSFSKKYINRISIIEGTKSNE